MSYDQGYWHTDACSENGVPEENAATHIAAYVHWCIKRNFISSEIEKQDAAPLIEVRAGKLSAAKYFEDYMDWKLGEWNLNEDGNHFTAAYYDSYLNDLEKHFPTIIYGGWENVDFVSLTQFLDSKLSEFQEGRLKCSTEKKSHGGKSGES
jgi:hypothetical protein